MGTVKITDTPHAILALITVDGKIVAVSRKDNPNDFGLPGGKVEPGESIEAALVREVMEETGLVVLSSSVVYEDFIRDSSQRRAVACCVNDCTGTLGDSRESGVVALLTKERLTDEGNTFHEYNRRLFAYLEHAEDKQPTPAPCR